jgi:hypothetical protein
MPSAHLTACNVNLRAPCFPALTAAKALEILIASAEFVFNRTDQIHAGLVKTDPAVRDGSSSPLSYQSAMAYGDPSRG